MSVDIAPFKWQIVGGCRHGFSIANQASISVGVEEPAALCSARVLDDKLNEFTLTLGDNEVIISPKFKPEYVANPNPYPCRVRLVTTRGVRTITIPPPKAETSQEKHDLEVGRVRAIASCYQWEKPFVTPLEKLKWQIYPPVGITQYLQFWQVVVSNLQTGDMIRVVDQEGETIMSAVPSLAGVAHLTLLFDGREAQAELLLELSGVIDESQERRSLAAQQILFIHRSSVSASAGLRQLSFERDQGRRLLIHASAGQEHRWDVSAPTLPLLYSAKGQGLHVDTKAKTMHSGKSVAPSISGNVLAALDTLGIHLKEIRVIGTPKVGGFKETLYVGEKRGGSLFDVSNLQEPREIQIYQGKPWFEGTALSGRLLARHYPERGEIDIFEATASRTI